MLQVVIYNKIVEKVSYSDEKMAIDKQSYNEPTKNNILKIYEEIKRDGSCRSS